MYAITWTERKSLVTVEVELKQLDDISGEVEDEKKVDAITSLNNVARTARIKYD